MDEQVRSSMIAAGCTPQMWRHEWNVNGPTWEDLNDNYRAYIQFIGFGTVDTARQWWNSRSLEEKREFFVPRQKTQRIMGGNPFIVKP